MSEFDAILARTEDLVGLLETLMIQLPWMFVVWSTFVGGAIGSFLNVVVYRMPAGLSISHPPSRCPKCKTPIRARDNIPILGWLWLGGKCRNCKLPIAVRYPLVESAVAVLFMLMAWSTVFKTADSAEVLIIFSRFVYYSNAAACLIALGLIDLDAQRIPRRLFLYAIVSITIIPVIWPRLWIVGELDFMTETFSPRAASFVAVLAQGAFGGISAGVICWAVSTRTSYLNCIETAILSGVIAGWWISILPVVALAMIVHWILSRGGRTIASLNLVLAILICAVIVVQLYLAAVVVAGASLLDMSVAWATLGNSIT